MKKHTYAFVSILVMHSPKYVNKTSTISLKIISRSPSFISNLYSCYGRTQRRIRLQSLRFELTVFRIHKARTQYKTLYTNHVQDPLLSGLQRLLDYPIINVYCGALNGTKQSSSSAGVCYILYIIYIKK